MLLPEVEDNWSTMAFTRNLNSDSIEASRRLKKRPREFPAKTRNNVYHGYRTKLRIEEDISVLPGFKVKIPMNTREIDQRPRHTRDDGNSDRRNDPPMHRHGKEPKTPKVTDYHSMPKLTDYGFSVNVEELVATLKDMGDKVRWPK